MVKQQLLVHLSEKEKAAALVQVGRAVRETFAGLDIITPEWAVIVSSQGVPLIASNVQDKEDVIRYARMLADCLARGERVAPVLVPQQKSMQAGFLSTMRRSRGTEPLDDESLCGLLRTYVNGYLDAVCQYAGYKAVHDIGNDYPWLTDPNWLPGPEWHYWKEEPNANT